MHLDFERAQGGWLILGQLQKQPEESPQRVHAASESKLAFMLQSLASIPTEYAGLVILATQRAEGTQHTMNVLGNSREGPLSPSLVFQWNAPDLREKTADDQVLQ